MATFVGTRDSNLGLTIDNQSRLALTLDTITQWDDGVGNIDLAEGNMDLGGTDSTSNPNYYNGNIKSSGLYDFATANQITLDDVYDTTFTVNVGMSTEDEYDLHDSGRGALLHDDAKGPYDGSAEVKAGAEIQVGASNTSLGAISTYQKIAQQATVKGRYFKFKAKLTNDDNKVKPKVHALSFTIVLENRTTSGNDITTGTTAYNVVFANPFYAIPSIGVATQNLASGDYSTITSKSKTGFTIQFFNSSATGISKTFDYQAIGFGLKS